eukprot:gene32054-biopygen9526
MAAKEGLHDQSVNNEMLCNILIISPTSELNVKSIGARELRAIALTDSTKVAGASAIPHLVALLSGGTQSGIQEDAVWALASAPAHVQQLAATALAHLLANNAGNQGMVPSAGAIPPLVAFVSAYTPAHVQQLAATALAHLLANNGGNQGMMASAGAILPLVTLLSAEHVQDQAVFALAHLVANNRDNQLKVAFADSIPSLVA